jgi:hypothetical protein
VRAALSDAEEEEEEEDDSDDEIFFGPSTIREACARTINGAGTPVRKTCGTSGAESRRADEPADASAASCPADSDEEEEIFFGDAGSSRECAQKLAAVRLEVESCLRGDGKFNQNFSKGLALLLTLWRRNSDG